MLADCGLSCIELFSSFSKAFVFVDCYKYFKMSSFYLFSPVLTLKGVVLSENRVYII